MTCRGTKITLADVARSACVSPATVSLALRDNPRISSRTREKVWRATQRLGYWTNHRREGPLPAFAPKSKVRNLGFILVGADETHYIFSQTFQAALIETHRAGNNLFCYPWLDPNSPPKQSLLDSPDSAGFLLMGAVADPHYEFLKKTGKPILLAGDHRVATEVNSVNFRNCEAGRKAVRYLGGLGHQRIAFVSESLSFLDRQAYHRGYRAEMDALGLPVREDWVQVRWQMTPVSEVIQPLFNLKERPTAILATSEGEASDVVECCRKRGLRVPGDVSLLFFGTCWDDVNRHPITHLAPPFEALGRIGIRRLHDLIVNPDELPLTTLLNLHFCDCGSCTPPTSNRKKKAAP